MATAIRSDPDPWRQEFSEAPQLVILMVWKIGIKFLSSLSLEDEEVRAAIVRLWAAEADCVDAKNNPEVHSISTWIPVKWSKWDWSCRRLTSPSSQAPRL